MDPDRVRSYLQVACAGLGFDIGEVWWMSNESGTSTVAQIEERNSSPEPSRGGGDSGRGGGSPPIIECPDGAVGHLDVSSVSGSAIGSNGASGGHAAVGGAKKRGPRKRFLQLYTSKAYCNQRSKLVQPHEMEDSDSDENDDNDKNDGENDHGGNDNGNELLPGQRKSPLFDRDASSSTSNSSSTSLTVRRHHNHNKNSHSPAHSHANSHSALLDEDEHVLSPRIVEAVTLSAQVVWANCQKQEGLLGRSDIKLQTAIGMPVGVDETGNVWVVVMFSPKNVESSSDAIDYLQYISRSAASSSIPCLLPVIRQEGRGEGRGGQAGPKMICDGSAAVKSEEGEESVEEEHHRKHNNHLNDNHNHNHHLVSIQPKVKPTDHTQELGDGVIAQFVSFRLTDDDENDTSLAAGMGAGSTAFDLDMSDNDLRNAPKDDFGIPMLPDMQQPQQIVLNDALTEAFDEASYGVWSTIMNSAGGDAIRTSGAIASKMHLIQERLEEFAMAFLGMSMFDVADAWITSIAGVVAENGTVNANAVDLGDGIVVCNEAPKLKCLFTVAAENMQNDNVHVFREVSASASIDIGDGAVGKAFSTGYPVWSSDKSIIYDKRRKNSLQNCKIESIFAVPIFSAGDVAPSCVLSCYSLVPVESVPFVLNFVQKAVRLLWDGLDKVKPHESVGKDLWKDVGPADLGEMAADLEMQKAFFGKKRTYSDLSATGQSTSVDNHKHNRPNPSSAQTGLTYLLAGNEDSNSTSRDRSSSYATQVKALSSVVPTSLFQLAPINAPPAKGLGPAPTFPTSVQRASSAQSFVLFNPQNNQGFQTIQQAVRSVGNVAEWHNSSGNNAQVNQYSTHIVAPPQAQQPNAQSSNSSQQSQFQPEYQYQMDENHNFFLSYANYGGSTVPTTWIEPTSQQNTTHSPSPPLSINPPPPQALSQPPGAAYHHGNNNSHPLEPPGTFAEDPAAARANIVEFNAMAQMHSTPAVPDNIAQYSTGYSRYENGTGDGTKDIPISQGNGSFVVTEQPQQSNGYTTPTAEHATQNSYGMSTDQSPQSVYCMTTGQPPQNIQFMPTAQPVVSIDPLNTSYNSSAEKICRIEGCNDVAHSKRPYCFRHCGNRQCEKEGCNKCAQGATRFCIAHGGGRRCTFPGCDKGARDKYFCAAHGGGKRCKHNGCSKSAVGGSSYCTSHGGGRRCQVEGCDKSAQSSTSFCVKHGGGKKCHHEGCEKVARGRTLYCAAHGGGIRCKLEGCNRVAIGKAQLCRTHGGGSNRMKAGVQQPMYPPLHNM